MQGGKSRWLPVVDANFVCESVFVCACLMAAYCGQMRLVISHGVDSPWAGLLQPTSHDIITACVCVCIYLVLFANVIYLNMYIGKYVCFIVSYALIS